MTVKVNNLKRIFYYENRPLNDLDLQMTPEEIKEKYAEVYPELTQAVIEGPEYKETSMIYTFTRSVATKGALCITQPLSLKELSEKGFSEYLEEKDQTRKEERCLTIDECEKLRKIFNGEGTPLLLHSSSIPLIP